MNNLQNELEKAKSLFKFQYLDEKNDLLKLSSKNVVLIEAIISLDSGYSKAGRKDAAPFGKYKGSTAYWMVELCNYLKSDSPDKNRNEFKRLVSEAVAAVDRENSTHLNVGNGRNEITNRIVQFGKKQLIATLQSSSLELFDKLAEPITVPAKKGEYQRRNISFASKFCHYLCFWLFENEPEADNYSIYDSFVRNKLPDYSNYYKIDLNGKQLDNYADYRLIIDQILEKSGNKISRNGFDHLLWYYYKAK